MNSDVIRRRNGPLEVESETDVVIVGGELPEYETAFFVSGHSHRHRLSAAYFDDGIIISSHTLLELLNVFASEHGRSRYGRQLNYSQKQKYI